MKTQNEQFMSLLSREELNKLGTTVRETVAQKSNKVFSAAELWNIQKSRRSTRSRRLMA